MLLQHFLRLSYIYLKTKTKPNKTKQNQNKQATNKQIQKKAHNKTTGKDRSIGPLFL